MFYNAIDALEKSLPEFRCYHRQQEASHVLGLAPEHPTRLSSARCSCHPSKLRMETSLSRQWCFQCSNSNHFKEQK